MDASLSIAMLPMPSWISLLLVTLGGVCSFAYLLRSILRGKEKRPASAKSKARLPPGPNGLPIIGNLHMLGSLPHRDLHRLAMKYGPIMYMQLGQVPVVIASSPQAAQLFLKTHDLVFSSRPITEVGKYTSYDGRGLADAPYGPYWRNMRKLCTLRLLSNLMIDSFKPMRREELGLLVQSLKDSARAHAMVDLTMKVSSLSTSMTCRTVLGKNYTDESFDKKGFKGVIDDLSAIVGAFNVADYIPYVGALDLQGLRRRAVAICKIFDDFFEKIIDEHVADRGERRERDFIDSMLSFMNSEENEFQFDRMNIKALILDLLVAAMDSSAAVMEWTLAELLKHPHVMKKAQEELETVVGLDRMVEESDLDMVIKESLRLHPVLPLLIPHKSTEDCTVDGYHIPKGSQLIINTWTIGRDPNVRTDPEEFNPERFKDTGIDVRGHDFQLLPFGSGRRGCPGMQFGLTVVRFVLAQLVHCFNWELPTGMQPTDLDMTEKFGLVVPKANHVLAIPTYRLRHAS